MLTPSQSDLFSSRPHPPRPLVVISIIGILLALTLAGVHGATKPRRASPVKTTSSNLPWPCINITTPMRALPPGHRSGRLTPRGNAIGYMPFSGWPLAVMPFVEQQSLYSQAQTAFRFLPLPFINPPHTGLSTVMPILDCPSDPRDIAELRRAAGSRWRLRRFWVWRGGDTPHPNPPPQGGRVVRKGSALGGRGIRTEGSAARR